MEQQNNIVTLTKAIGIILMVVAHAMPPEHVVWRIIYTFHMPLFFIMSGYCFKEKYLDDAKQFVVRKIKGIYVPYVLFALPFLAMHNVFCRWNIYESTWLYGWKEFAWNAGRIVTRMSMNEGLLGTFWFLKELFWGSLIFYAALKLAKKVSEHWRLDIAKYRAEWVTVIGLLVLAEVLCITHLRLPYFNVTYNSVYAAFFIAVGYLWKRADWHVNKWIVWIIGASAITIELLLMHKMGFLWLSPIQLLIYALPAIVGTMMVYELCRRIVDSRKSIVDSLMRGLEFVGKHTLAIMALHLSAFKLVSYILIRVNHLPIERLEDFPVMYDYANTGGGMLLYAFVGICIPLICVMVWQWGLEKVKSVRCKV